MKGGLVYVMHGVGDRPVPSSFQDRNLLDREWFRHYLDRRPRKFVSLEQALIGAGDALTIDDGVYACADAAIDAREWGHEVTLFVNPFHVEDGSPYWFSLMNLALDRTERGTVLFNDREYSLNGSDAKQQYRNEVKARVCQLTQEHERLSLIHQVMEQLGVVDRQLPRQLQPLTHNDLKTLVALGVRIENHGWTHFYPGAMTANEIGSEIVQGRAWLEQNLGIQSRVFAAPFGESLPPLGLTPGLVDQWFLADYRLPPGPAGGCTLNRKILGPKPSPISRLISAFRRWLK